MQIIECKIWFAVYFQLDKNPVFGSAEPFLDPSDTNIDFLRYERLCYGCCQQAAGAFKIELENSFQLSELRHNILYA